MGIVVDHQDRRQSAGTKTGYRFQCEPFIGTCLPWNKVQLIFQCLENRFGSPNMTGRPLADTDDVAPAGIHVKL